jgi:uncharacterized Tic20 family protein
MSVANPSAYSRTPVPHRAASGRLRQEGLAESDRNFAICIHLSPLVLGILGLWPLSIVAPLALWLIRRNASVFNDDHGREVTNFVLSFTLWHIVTLITVVGIVLWPVLWIVAIVNSIRGAVAAGSGEYFRYPMTVRFLS